MDRGGGGVQVNRLGGGSTVQRCLIAREENYSSNHGS